MARVKYENSKGESWDFHADKVVDTADGSVRLEGTKWGTIYLQKDKGSLEIHGEVEDSK